MRSVSKVNRISTLACEIDQRFREDRKDQHGHQHAYSLRYQQILGVKAVAVIWTVRYLRLSHLLSLARCFDSMPMYAASSDISDDEPKNPAVYDEERRTCGPQTRHKCGLSEEREAKSLV